MPAIIIPSSKKFRGRMASLTIGFGAAEVIPVGRRVTAFRTDANAGLISIQLHNGTDWADMKDINANIYDNNDGLTVVACPGVPMSDGTNVRFQNDAGAGSDDVWYYYEEEA